MKRSRRRWPDMCLCEGFKRLWTAAFGDTEEYISLVFERVYSQSMTRWREASVSASQGDMAGKSGIPVAMLFATPCLFRIKETLSSRMGVYLSGLATDSEYRRKGIMTSLIEGFIAECHNRRKSGKDSSIEGCADFLFLIPADTHLRRYYEGFGFRSSGERIVVRINLTSGAEGDNRWRVIDLSALSAGDRRMIHKRILQYEKRGMREGYLQIFHSHEAIDTAIAESVLNKGCIVTDDLQDCFLWVEPCAGGEWISRVWHVTAPEDLTVMQAALSAIIPPQGGGRMSSLLLYGSSWQSDIIWEMYRRGMCSEPENEPYGMILPLTEDITDYPMSIGLMLD